MQEEIAEEWFGEFAFVQIQFRSVDFREVVHGKSVRVNRRRENHVSWKVLLFFKIDDKVKPFAGSKCISSSTFSMLPQESSSRIRPVMIWDLKIDFFQKEKHNIPD